MSQLEKLKEKWSIENINKFYSVDIDALQKFQIDNNVILPNDLKKYFESLNGTGEECNDELYEFYSISRIKKVAEEFKDWKGIPNYKPLLDINYVNDLFVFANFSFNLFAYAIRLYPEMSDGNEVNVLCGDEYKNIANTFSEFLELYMGNSIEFQLNK